MVKRIRGLFILFCILGIFVTPVFGTTPDADKSSISSFTIETGLEGVIEVEVLDSGESGITGITADKFSVGVKLGDGSIEQKTFAESPFSEFYETSDGGYRVGITGTDFNQNITLSDLTVEGVIIEATSSATTGYANPFKATRVYVDNENNRFVFYFDGQLELVDQGIDLTDEIFISVGIQQARSLKNIGGTAAIDNNLLIISMPDTLETSGECTISLTDGVLKTEDISSRNSNISETLSMDVVSNILYSNEDTNEGIDGRDIKLDWSGPAHGFLNHKIFIVPDNYDIYTNLDYIAVIDEVFQGIYTFTGNDTIEADSVGNPFIEGSYKAYIGLFYNNSENELSDVIVLSQPASITFTGDHDIINPNTSQIENLIFDIGLKGSFELRIENNSAEPVSGISASEISVEVKLGENNLGIKTFAEAPFSEFTETQEAGIYRVSFTGTEYDQAVLFTNLTVRGVNIEASKSFNIGLLEICDDFTSFKDPTPVSLISNMFEIKIEVKDLQQSPINGLKAEDFSLKVDIEGIETQEKFSQLPFSGFSEEGNGIYKVFYRKESYGKTIELKELFIKGIIY